MTVAGTGGGPGEGVRNSLREVGDDRGEGLGRRRGPSGGAFAMVRSHPIGALLLWFFTIGQAVAFVPVIAQGHGVTLPTAPFVVASTAVGLLLPTIAITWVVDGHRGLMTLVRRLTAVRVGVGWYVVALGLIPLGTVLIAMALVGRPAGTTALTAASAVLTGLVVQTVLGLVTSNLAEEAAWTGLVQARLQQVHGPMTAALVTAPLFALQHLPLAVANAGSGAPVLLMVLILLAVPFRALVGWAYHRTGSLFLVGLVHAAGNATAGGTGLGPGLLPRLYPGEPLGPVHVFAFAVIGLAVALATRGRLGTRPAAGRQGAPASTPAGASVQSRARVEAGPAKLTTRKGVTDH